MKEDCLNGGLLAKGLALFDNLVLPTPVILYRKVPSTYIYIYGFPKNMVKLKVPRLRAGLWTLNSGLR